MLQPFILEEVDIMSGFVPEDLVFQLRKATGVWNVGLNRSGGV
jgi:hypothetical protein